MREFDYDWLGKPDSPYELLNSRSQREVVKRRALDLAVASHGKSMVIFLDKTARPLHQLLRECYPIIYPKEPLPKIKFVNIGTEKGWSIRNHLRKVLGERYSGDLVDNLGEIKDRNDLSRIFNHTNVDYLVKLFKSSKAGEQRLIVDDLTDSGTTKAIAIRILSCVDPQSRYDFFEFLKSDKDREPFRKGAIAPFFPWHSTYTLVHDQTADGLLDENSFKVQPERDAWRVERSRLVRDELHKLCGELKSEYHPVR